MGGVGSWHGWHLVACPLCVLVSYGKGEDILTFLIEMRSIISCDANEIFKAAKMFLVSRGGGGSGIMALVACPPTRVC